MPEVDYGYMNAAQIAIWLLEQRGRASPDAPSSKARNSWGSGATPSSASSASS